MKHSYSVGDLSAVHLRPLEPEDLTHTLAWRNQDDTRKWFRFSDVLSLEQHEGWYRSYLTKPNDYMFVTCNGSEPIGQVGLYNLNEHDRSAEVGRFVVSPSARGRGLMQAGIGLLMDLARDQLSLKSLYLEVKEDNAIALHLYKKLGFTAGGPAKDGYVFMRSQI